MKNTNTMTKNNNNNTKPVIKPVVIKPVVIIKPEPMQWKHYD
tara:strand:- start:858 stop:983 length:126 start_codon:yes stop_codon:yes gene_type:complete